MEFTYMKTPLYKYTFSNKRIREWVESQVSGYVLNLFAGETKLNCIEVRNDMREEMPADYHMDAFKFVEWWKNQNARTLFDSVILDPPYSYRKSMTRYEGAVASDFRLVKDLLPQIMAYEGNVITFGYHCLDEETQCLTENGWKYFNNLNKETNIATLNKNTDILEYNPINEIFVYPYKGAMKSMSDRHLNQLITPNHKMLLKYKHQNNDKKGNNILWKDKSWQLINSSLVTPHSGVYIPVSGNYDGEISIGTDMSELLGWIIAEGHMTPYGSIFIYQSLKNKENVDRIRKLLIQLKLSFTDKIYPNKPELVNFYLPKGQKKEDYEANKKFYKLINEMLYDIKSPKWSLLHLKHNELQALFTGLVDGDRSHWNDTSCIFYQKSDYCREWFQTLCAHLGYRTTNNSTYKTVNVSFKNEKLIAPGERFKNTFTNQKYNGLIWCVSVKNNNFLVRRNNKISFTGNSNVMGKVRGFEQEHLLVMSHGGAIHDTIAVSERRVGIT